MQGESGKKKVAVVGSGLAGLTAAWLLQQQGHEVTIYEREKSLGMDAASANIAVEERVAGQTTTRRVDVPLRVFTPMYYPNLTALYTAVGIKFRAEDYCSSFSDATHKREHPFGQTYFEYRNWLLGKLSVPFLGTLSTVLRPGAWRIALDWLRFTRVSLKRLQDGSLRKITFAEFCAEHEFSQEFVRDFVEPALAAICTCSVDSVRRFPAAILCEYLARRNMTGVRRAVNGTLDVVTRLSEGCEVRLGCGASTISYVKGKVEVTSESGDVRTFDHVIVATPPSVASRLLRSQKDEHLAKAAQLLAKVRCENSRVIVHQDPRLMPKRRRDWRSVNFSTRHSSTNMPTATIWMNNCDDRFGATRDVFQTWNPHYEPRADTVLAQGEFVRPVHDLESCRAMKQLRQEQGQRNVWFVGSYVPYGVPLLENAVESAVSVARQLGAPVPWDVVKCADRSVRAPSNVLLLLPLLVGLLALAIVTTGAYFLVM